MYIGSYHVNEGHYGSGNIPSIYRMECGNNDTIDSCTIFPQGNCPPGQDVGVVCQGNIVYTTANDIHNVMAVI